MRWRPARLSLGVATGMKGSGPTVVVELGDGGEHSAKVSAPPFDSALRSFEKEFHLHFDLLVKLGSGSTSTVSKAVWKADRSMVAVKVTRSCDSNMILYAQKEYELLRKLSYPTLPCVHHFQAYPEFGRAAMVMSYFDGLEMQRAVASAPGGRLDESVVRKCARQLMSTLDYLHSREVLHRDIKPQNMLISHDSERICLIDFNASHCLSDGEPLTPTGTRLYLAPEVVQGEGASTASDVWGAGVCLYFALCGHLPQGRTSSSSDSCTLQRQCVREVAFRAKSWEHISDPCKRCLRKSLALEEQQRPGAAELLRTEPWLATEASS